KIHNALKEADCDIPTSAVLGLERLIGARARLQEAKPQTRAEGFHRWVQEAKPEPREEVFERWLNEVVKPGRVVGIGRSGRRLVIVTEKRDGNVRGFCDDGSRARCAQQR